MKFIKNKKILIISISVIVAIILIVSFSGGNDKKAETIAKDYTVEIGTIDSTISGKATVQPNDQYTVTSVVSGDVLNTYFEEGDVVTKDAIMYEIDSSDVDKNIESSDLNLRRAHKSLNDLNDNISDLTIYSSHSGTTQNVTIKVGDNIQNGQVLAKVYDDSYMIIKIPFNETDANKISVGQEANVTLTTTNAELNGVVTKVSSSSYALSGYMRVKDIEIKVKNPGAIKVGDKGMALVGDIACNSAGTFEYLVNEEIKATASGKIVKLNIKNNEKITKGGVVAILDSEDLIKQRENSEIAIREAEIAKEKTLDALDNYTIKAPIEGTVITKDVKVGDKLDNTKGATQLAIIYDLSSLKFDMDVDELDIAKVKVGQEVVITADAVLGKTYNGVVEKININGTSSNGVTSYPVTVRITEFEDLLPGMNIDAEIVIEKAENILIIPSECLNRGNIVYVKGEKTDKEDSAPEGYKSVKVETGIANTSFVEIKSGLKEGETVRGREIMNNNKIMEEMEEQMQSGGMPMPSGNMPMGGGMPGMR